MMKFIHGILIIFLALVIFAIVVITRTLPVTNILLWGGTQSATANLPSGLGITLSMAPDFSFSSIDYERRLKVCREGFLKCNSKWLIMAASGGTHLNIYKDTEGNVVVVDYVWMMRVEDGPKITLFDHSEEEAARLRKDRWDCQKEEPRPTSLIDPPASRYFKELRFLGAIGFFTDEDEPAQRKTFRFSPFDARAEILCAYPSRG